MEYLPEGILFEQTENRCSLMSTASLYEAMAVGKILEARAILCSENHDLTVDLGAVRGIIPREEAAIGISEGITRDIAIISRVGRPVAFVIQSMERDAAGRITAVLSRRAAQERCRDEYLAALKPGDIIPARITHLESFGAFADIGCGIISLMPIDTISVSRISHPRDRFRPGQLIKAVVRSREGGRISLTHKELLGTWSENASVFSSGETVSGIIRSVEDYGIFVELSPNLAGLAEPKPGIRPGQQASVFIKNILPEKMKVKLVIIDAFDDPLPPGGFRYRQQSGHISRWQYSPAACSRVIETIFDEESS
ncbi:MAG: 30S ribosomal protein S1 [Oscillospiraceae bacterium]|nr:30S ribosomal protein S1 [Oscillospiraceae bacterium]